MFVTASFLRTARRYDGYADVQSTFYEYCLSVYLYRAGYAAIDAGWRLRPVGAVRVEGFVVAVSPRCGT